MEKIRNLSLKKTILLYFVISLTAAFLLSGFTVHFARNMQNKIWEKYIDYADYTDVFQQYGKKYFSCVPMKIKMRYDLIRFS